MQQPYFVADGTVTAIDTVAKRMKMDVKKIIFHDKNFETQTTQHIETDVSLATVSVDTGAVPLSYVKPGMHATAASYAEALKNVDTAGNNTVESILKKIPKLIPIDEIKIILPESQEQQKKKQAQAQSNPVDWLSVLWAALIILAALTVLVFASPWLIMLYLSSAASRQGTAKQNASNGYVAAMFYLNQLGYFRTNQGPRQYAMGIDEKFGTGFEQFNAVWQKAKYSNTVLTNSEVQTINTFYKPFVKQVRNNVPFGTRLSKFLNIYNTIHFFRQPKIS
jgi:hypothetical protein